MAWRNLRSEIGEMFADYSRGEERQEFAQAIEARRKALARGHYDPQKYAAMKADKARWASHHEIYRRWYQKLKSDAERYRRHNTARRNEARARALKEIIARQCLRCGKAFVKPLARGPQYYCSEACSEAVRADAQRAWAQKHADDRRQYRARWYQENKDRLSAKYQSQKAEVAR